MADVRSLLKNERAARRIDHPQASYSSTGMLECIVCKLPLKSDIEVWNKHLKSTQHAMRAERLRISQRQPPSKTTPGAAGSVAITPAGADQINGSKKRKAYDHDAEEDSRKRTRPEDPKFSKPISSKRKLSFTEPKDAAIEPLPKIANVKRPSSTQVTDPLPAAASTETVDEGEWAAFEASVARPASPSPPPLTGPTAALTAAANISAAPLSAAELAAHSREEASLQSKERREAEVEGEKEDAARQLEEEFDEMEGLEERVRRLKEQRERLRVKGGDDVVADRMKGVELGGSLGDKTAAKSTKESEDEDEDDDEDLDDWDGWGRA